MTVPIYKIRNENGSLRSKMIEDAARKPLYQIQLAANFRSSNYSATQNFVNIDDLTPEMIAGETQAQ